MSTQQKNPQTWKKIIDLVIVILTAIGSFIGGQASAQNGLIDMFNKQKIENNG